MSATLRVDDFVSNPILFPVPPALLKVNIILGRTRTLLFTPVALSIVPLARARALSLSLSQRPP
jgi:hypothetical protein